MSIKALKKRMASVIAQHPPNADVVRLLLIDTRVAMEDQGVNRDYPTIGLYGNWAVHPKLTHKAIYHDIVADAQAAYEQCKSEEKEELLKLGSTLEDADAKQAPISGKPMNNFFTNMRRCFRIGDLRNELLNFYDRNNISSLLIKSDENWQQFIFLLLHSLIDRPIEVPEHNERYSQLKSRSERAQWTPVKLLLEERRSQEGENEIELWWVIQMIAPVRITGRLFKAKFAWPI